MSLATNVTATEAEVIRIYEVALPEAEANALAAEDVATALGVDDLDGEYVDIFPVSALDQYGLAGFMTEGLGIPPEAIGAYAERIAQVDGVVVVVLSKAFQGKTATLKNGHPLRLIGAFSERKAESAPVDLTSEAATERVEPKPKKQKSEAAQSGMVATFALLFLFIFVAVIVWIS